MIKPISVVYSLNEDNTYEINIVLPVTKDGEKVTQPRFIYRNVDIVWQLNEFGFPITNVARYAPDESGIIFTMVSPE